MLGTRNKQDMIPAQEVEQCCLTEYSVMMAQDSIHSHVCLLNTWNVAHETEELNFNFNLCLINLNVNSGTWG